MKDGSTYTITATFDIDLRPNSLTVHNPESVAAAISHYLRMNLPGQCTRGGYSFRTGTIEVDAVRKGSQTTTGETKTSKPNAN